jgi:hypothetical protein
MEFRGVQRQALPAPTVKQRSAPATRTTFWLGHNDAPE